MVEVMISHTLTGQYLVYYEHRSLEVSYGLSSAEPSSPVAKLATEKVYADARSFLLSNASALKAPLARDFLHVVDFFAHSPMAPIGIRCRCPEMVGGPWERRWRDRDGPASRGTS